MTCTRRDRYRRVAEAKSTEGDAMPQPPEEKIRVQLNALARLISEYCPPGYGFALFMFEAGRSDGMLNYISNANRGNMIRALKEFLVKFEGDTVDVPDTAS